MRKVTLALLVFLSLIIGTVWAETAYEEVAPVIGDSSDIPAPSTTSSESDTPPPNQLVESQPVPENPGPPVNPDWTWEKIKVSNIKQVAGSEYEYTLTRDNGRWKIVYGAEARMAYGTPGADYEQIAFDPRTQTLYLRFTSICTRGKDQSATDCSCTRGLMSEANRQKGYTLCSSAFKTPRLGVVEGLSAGISTVLFGVFGSTSIVYWTDTDAVLAAAKEADLLNAINKTHYSLYKSAFSSALNAPDQMRIFIASARRTGYDPDDLASEGEKLLPLLMKNEEDAERISREKRYRSSFSAAKTSQQWRTFIEQYQNLDPDHLIPRAQEQLKLAEASEKRFAAQVAREEKDRRAQLMAAMRKIGTTICSYGTGDRKEYIGYVALLNKPLYETTQGESVIQGFIEDHRDGRIKITISNMRHRSANSAGWVNLELVSYKGNSLKNGSVIWDDMDAWSPC